MRLALFTEVFLPKVDGMVQVVCLLLDHLVEQGIETVIITPRYGDLTSYRGFRVINLPSVPFPLYPEARIALPTPSMWGEFHAFQPDIVHFVHPFISGVPSLAWVKRHKYLTLISFHLDYARLSKHYRLGWLKGFGDFATRRVFNSADYSLAPSKTIQRQMQQMGVQNVGWWKRGVDSQKFHPRHRNETMRQRLSKGQVDSHILLYVGRLSPEKQLDSLRQILDVIPNTCLALVGDGPARRKLEKHFAGTNTVFMGYLSGEELLQAYASADVFVFPSAMETFGLVVLEAMASGVPVVASRVGGVLDVIEAGVTGYTFEVGDSDAMIDSVRHICADNRYRQMGQPARTFAETMTWDIAMQEVIEHYQRIIDEKK